MQMSNLGNTKDVTIVVHATLPGDELLDNSSIYEKKAMHKYNIEWLFDQVKLVGDIKQRYLYVTRNLYETVTSRLRGPEEDFAQRVQGLNDFQLFIEMEQNIINKKAKEDLWRQVSYEWFKEMRNCTALVSAVIDFAGWSHCDVDFACQILPSLLSNITASATTTTTAAANSSSGIDAERVHYAESHTLQLKIPALDIAPQTEYRHSTVVSVRTLPFNLQPDATQPGTTITRTRVSPTRVTPTPPVRRLPPPSIVDLPPAGPTGVARNNVSFLYIVGVEGTGHHGVTPAIASIAKTCNYHVIYESTVLRNAGAKLLPRTYQAGLNTHKKLEYSGTKKVLIIEDQSFPTDTHRRVSSMESKKASGKYNLEWMYDRSVEAGIDMRFLYLTRDFYKAVASHPEFDVTFHRHADVLRDFIWYINSEYELISKKKEGLWKQVSYEWFKEMRNCTALVSAVIDFAGWNHCDVDFACQILGQTLRNSTKRTVNATELAYARSMNVTLPIPVLDITPNQTFAFEPVVSRRVPFSFIKNITHSKKHTIRLRPRTNMPKKPAPAATKVTATTANVHVRSSSSNNSPNNGIPLPPPRVAPAAGSRTSSSGAVAAASASEGSAQSRLLERNEVSMLYLVGVEGAGHPMATAALSSIARACKYHVIVHHPGMQRAQTGLLPRAFKAAALSVQHAMYPSASNNKVVVIGGFPMYADGTRNTRTSAEKRQNGKYNIGWLAERAQESNLDARFLYLERPFVDVLSAGYSSGSAAGSTTAVPFSDHTESVHSFLTYIQEEYMKVESTQPGRWAQLPVQWLAELQDCAALVVAVMGFAGWTDCDVAEACSVLRAANLTLPAAPSLTAEQTSTVASYNVSSSIPYLQYTAAGASV